MMITSTTHDRSDVVEYTEGLPFKLKRDLSVAIYADMLAKIPSLASKDEEFITLVGPMLSDGHLPQDETLFM